MQDAPAQPTTSREGAAPRTEITQVDALTVYGPLGIFCTILLAIAWVLWKDNRAQRREFLEAQKRRDDECKAERDEFRETMVVMAKEAAEASKKYGEMWRDHARELRGAFDSATRKIGSRE